MSIPLRALLFRRTSEPASLVIRFDGEDIHVRLRRNAQARRYTLRIQSATREVVLTLPPRGSIAQARDFAQRHAAWIATRLQRLPQGVPFAHGSVIPLRGAAARIEHRPLRRGTCWLEDDGAGTTLLCVAGEAPHLPRRVRDYLKREAKKDLEAATRRFAQALEVTHARVSIRDQTSRWGSCSTTGVLSYSWRLILAPPFVLDYLAAHEVSHIREMNHGRRFWRLVDSICPDMRSAKAWLEAHGADLHRYGAETDRQ